MRSILRPCIHFMFHSLSPDYPSCPSLFSTPPVLSSSHFILSVHIVTPYCSSILSIPSLSLCVLFLHLSLLIAEFAPDGTAQPSTNAPANKAACRKSQFAALQQAFEQALGPTFASTHTPAHRAAHETAHETAQFGAHEQTYWSALQSAFEAAHWIAFIPTHWSALDAAYGRSLRAAHETAHGTAFCSAFCSAY